MRNCSICFKPTGRDNSAKLCSSGDCLKAYRRAKQARLRAGILAPGLCVACGEPTGKSGQAERCTPCLKEHLRTLRIGYRPLASGLCKDCGEPTGGVGQVKRCAVCKKRNFADRAVAYYSKNPDRVLALAQKYRKANRALVVGKTRAWRKTERARTLKVLTDNRRRARLLDGRSKGISAEDWRSRLDEFGHACAYCLQKTKLTVDHVHPISKEGLDEIDNVVPACAACNSSKSARTLLEWLRRGGWVNGRAA